MLAAQRQARILEELERSGGVRVSELVRLLRVSDMTVRRDLDALARRGVLDKVHGGATLPVEGSREASGEEPGFAAKSVREQAEKEAIARRAASFVEPGMAVSLTAGTTTYALAQQLIAVPGITVVTNSIRVSEVLHSAARPDQTVLLTGGLRTPSDALVGPVAVDTLRSLHVDVCFMGVHGMEETTGFTTPNLMEAETNRAMLRNARRLVVVADSTKWGTLGLASIAELDEAETVVTDERLPAAAREVLAENVDEVVLVAVADPAARGA